MFWKGTTPWGGFAGLVSGTLAGLVLYRLELAGTIVYGAPMAGNFWRAWWAWVICVAVTAAVSLLTSRSPARPTGSFMAWYGALRRRRRV